MIRRRAVLTLFFLIAISGSVSAQKGNLLIEIDDYYYSDCLRITVYTSSDTIYQRDITEEYTIPLNDLDSGRYYVTLAQCGTPNNHYVESVTQSIYVRANYTAVIGMILYNRTNYWKLDPADSAIIDERTELQYSASYFDYRWNPDNTNPKLTAGISLSSYQWYSFSKHAGLLLGGGGEFMFAPLRVDSVLQSNFNAPVKSSYYSYLGAQLDAKLRLSSGNQQRTELRMSNLFLDIGILYNLPLYFKWVTRFNYQDKSLKSFIHQYTDARVYANIGFNNCQLFLSYRPFDFVRGELTQLPKFNTGIKFNLNTF